MINFSDLELRVNDKYSFVGIERKGNGLIFHLPKGFPADDSSLNTFDKKRDLFFSFYKVFKVFEHIRTEKGDATNQVSDRDGVVEENEGAEITANPDIEENLVYYKLHDLDSILDVYDELKILALVSRLGRSEAIDYSQLHRFLHRGIFLPNGAVYIDSMTLPRLEVRYDESDIARMYSYILTEVKQQLNEAVSPEIIAFSERFKHKYIGFDCRLFSEEYYQQVMDLLKDALELIDDQTSLKDADYWDFYDAIEAFLFGEINWNKEGEIWGVNNFWSVWESMCLTYLVKTTDTQSIIHIDSSLLSIKFHPKTNYVSQKFYGVFRTNNGNLVPDALLINQTFGLKRSFRPQNEVINVKVNDWDDYGFRTLLACQLGNADVFGLKIAYKNQAPNQIHTYYIHGGLNKEKEFYSYWNWEEVSLSPKQKIQLMQEYNHLFYVAIINKLFEQNAFIKYFSKKGAVIPVSFFRNYYGDSGRCIEKTMLKIYEEFIKFIGETFPLPVIYEIIDIKYFKPDYFLNSNNMEEIKRRSVRKQFVYEHLIQKHLEKSDKLFKEWEIKSEFWLPVYSPNGPTFSDGPQYLDGYIKLVGVNIMDVIDKYVEDYTTG